MQLCVKYYFYYLTPSVYVCEDGHTDCQRHCILKSYIYDILSAILFLSNESTDNLSSTGENRTSTSTCFALILLHAPTKQTPYVQLQVVGTEYRRFSAH
jgi:hypothetical protein